MAVGNVFSTSAVPVPYGATFSPAGAAVAAVYTAVLGLCPLLPLNGAASASPSRAEITKSAAVRVGEGGADTGARLRGSKAT